MRLKSFNKSITASSDFLLVNLLANHRGCLGDATIMCTTANTMITFNEWKFIKTLKQLLKSLCKLIN